jgi:plastocyanin
MHRFPVFSASMLTVSLSAVLLAPAAVSQETRDFYIKTVHIDGSTSTVGDADHKPEPFPNQAMPEGKGLVLTKPDEAGKWRMRAFAFVPSQIVVKAGDTVRLHFVGVQGMSHSIHIRGEGVDETFTLKRGSLHSVNFSPKSPGVIEIDCADHQPSMRGEIVVLSQ